MAINIPIVFPNDLHNPNASPSKKEWTERAIIITKGVVLEQHPLLLVGFLTLTSCLTSSFETNYSEFDTSVSLLILY